MISPQQSSTKMNRKADLERSFSDYIKLVMRKEIAQAKEEVKREFKRDTYKLTKSIAEELAGLSGDTHESIAKVEKKLDTMRSNQLKSLDAMSNIFCKQIENIEDSLKQEIRETTNKVFQSMSKQVSKLSVSMIKLSERVHNNEETLHNTRDDNGAISMILHDFANKISSNTTKPKVPKPELNNLESPFSALKTRNREDSEIRAS